MVVSWRGGVGVGMVGGGGGGGGGSVKQAGHMKSTKSMVSSMLVNLYTGSPIHSAPIHRLAYTLCPSTQASGGSSNWEGGH